nr:MAG TPA: hypothetical protein [Bacteriophage sp.]
MLRNRSTNWIYKKSFLRNFSVKSLFTIVITADLLLLSIDISTFIKFCFA